MFQELFDGDLADCKLRGMPRERRQDGWVERTGKKVKTWTGYYYVYVREKDGPEKRKQRSKVVGKCSDMTKGAAEDALRVHIRSGRPPSNNATFSDLAAWYLKTKEGHISKDWAKSLDSLFKHQILPRIGSMLAEKIRQSDVQQAIDSIAADPTSQSRSIVDKAKTHIRAVFEFALEEEYLQRNPIRPRKLKMPKTRRPSERFLTLEECRRVLAAGTPRDQIITSLFIVCGLRPSELFAMRVNDVTPGALVIDETFVEYEVKDQTKTEGSRGIVPLPARLEADLRSYIEREGFSGKDFLFPSEVGTPMIPENYLDRVLKLIGIEAGIDVVKDGAGNLISSELNFQVFRRTCATHFQNHGQIKDTQALLRHERSTTTLEHYQKSIPESLAGAVESWCSAILGRPEGGDPGPAKDSPAAQTKGPATVTPINRKRKVS